MTSTTAALKRPWVSALATIATALACNACCWLPPLLIGLSGTGAGFLAFLDPYKPYLIAFTALQLSVGLYLVYRKPKVVHECAAHGHEAHRLMNIRIMWCVVAFVVLLNAWDLTHPHHHGHPSTSVASKS